MDLQLKPHPQNMAPLGGILLSGRSPVEWLRAMQMLGLPLSAGEAFALPLPDSAHAWGCLLVHPLAGRVALAGPHQYCQLVHELLFIPERSVVFPAVSAAELDRLLLSRRHFWHPDTGLIELIRPIDWAELLTLPVERTSQVRQPAPSSALPEQVRHFAVQPAPPEQVLEKLEQDAFPKREPLPETPLNLLEKIRLKLYRPLLGKPGSDKPAPVASLLAKLVNRLKKTAAQSPDWVEQLRIDQAELERRNQEQVQRLVDLLKANPAEALRYAIPLDEGGTGRGANDGVFSLNLRWADLSLFGRSGPAGRGGVTLGDDKFEQLRQQYTQTAEELVQRGDFRKAAFVYLKLLKDYHEGAKTLEEGRFFAEAASVWLRYRNDKVKAAECYEKANMMEAAIDLYKELKQHERAGDLYASLHRSHEARQQYQLVLDELTARQQYVKAALLCRQKLHDPESGQTWLLRGWRENRDAHNCLVQYFGAITVPEALNETLQTLYATEVNDTNRAEFLQVLRHEYKRFAILSEPITDMAHELIVAMLPTNPAKASELRHFDAANAHLVKDIVRYRASRKS